MACNCGKKKRAALAQQRAMTAAAQAQKPPLVPTRPATWNGNEEKK